MAGSFSQSPRDAVRSTVSGISYYPDNVPRSLDYPAIPAWKLLERTASDFGDRPACRYLHREWTWEQIWTDAARAAAVLRRLGVRPGDRVGLMLPNVPEYLTALNGIWMAGGVAVALSPLMVAEEVSTLLEATECRIVVTLDMLLPLVDGGDHRPEQVLLVTLSDQLPTLESLGYLYLRHQKTGHWRIREDAHHHWFNSEVAAAEPAFDDLVETPPHHPAYILPTGGTTGAPKAVVLSHRNLVSNAWQQFHWAGGRRAEDTLLAVLPFFHSYGLSATLLTGTVMAATLIMHHRFNTRQVLKLIERHRPTVFHAVPAMLTAMNERLRQKRTDLSSIRWVISGGAPLPAAVAEEFASYSGALVVEGYGLSEAGPVTHVGPLDEHARYGTIGLPLPDTEARIVDVETGTTDLPPGEVGELVVRGPQVMLGYWNNPAETARAIRDGWLFTGDLAVCEPDGFYRIVDRKKDLIITSGFNVYPTDVEFTLRKFADLEEVAVIGVPDDRRGEAVKALVVMKKGTEFNRETFDAFCHEHLSAHKRPRLVDVLDELPKNFLGKVIRRHLRESAAAATTDTTSAPSAESNGRENDLHLRTEPTATGME